MTNLEVGLGLALASSVALLFRTHRKLLILRHLFVLSSDWCANKIGDLADTATDSIIQQAQWARELQGRQMPEDEARTLVPDVILEAKQNWTIQKEAFQADLARNGIVPLGQSDIDDFIWNRRRAGYKGGPAPKYIDGQSNWPPSG